MKTNSTMTTQITLLCAIFIALGGIVGGLLADPSNGRRKMQDHQIVVSNGTRVLIQYNINDNENIVYGTGQHIAALKEALAILESIANSTKTK